MDRRLLHGLVPPRDRIGPDAGHGDADLLDRYGGCRDERAFEELLTRHGPAVWGVCRRMLPQRQDAEDAFQATFVAMIRLAESGRRPGSLAGWLVRVAGRVSLNARREAGRSRRRLARVARPEAGAPVAGSLYESAYAAFREEVAALPETLRVAYLACELGGTPQPQAAVQLGLRPSALSTRLARARRRLEARLIARGLAPALAAALLAGTATTLSAMPTRVVILVQTLAANPAAVPTALSILATTGVPLMMTKLKFATLAGLAAVAGTLTLGVGGHLLPGAGAQAPPAQAAPAPSARPAPARPPAPAVPPAAAPAPSGQPATAPLMVRVEVRAEPKFEYRYHPAPKDSLPEFQAIVEAAAREGFEFAGLTPAFPTSGAHLVLRRPNPQATQGQPHQVQATVANGTADLSWPDLAPLGTALPAQAVSPAAAEPARSVPAPAAAPPAPGRAWAAAPAPAQPADPAARTAAAMQALGIRGEVRPAEAAPRVAVVELPPAGLGTQGAAALVQAVYPAGEVRTFAASPSTLLLIGATAGQEEAVRRILAQVGDSAARAAEAGGVLPGAPGGQAPSGPGWPAPTPSPDAARPAFGTPRSAPLDLGMPAPTPAPAAGRPGRGTPRPAPATQPPGGGALPPLAPVPASGPGR